MIESQGEAALLDGEGVLLSRHRRNAARLARDSVKLSLSVVHAFDLRETPIGMKQAEPDRVRQAVAGDRGAFAALTETHWAGLVRLARSIVGDSVAEDAVQDGLITAWSRLGTLRDVEAFSAWVTRIVLRQCLRHKRRWRELLPIGTAAEPMVEISPNAEIDLERCLRRLAPRQRAVMFLTVVEGRTDSEIADLMQITAASVRSHRRRARQRLSKLFSGASHAT